MSLADRRSVGRALSFVRAVVRLYRERNIPFMAGSIAYAAFISLIPTVLLLLVAASVVGGEPLQAYVLDLTEQYLTPTSQGVLEQSIATAADQVGLSVLGGIALIWAVLKVFRSLDTAFAELYGAPSNPGIVDQVTDGFVVAAVMLTVVLTTVATATVLAAASAGSLSAIAGLPVASALPVVRAVGFVALVVGLVLAFLPIYYLFPDVPMRIREALPGAFVAALGWTALQALFQVYVAMSSASQLYGVVGAVILIITWLYFGAVVVLLGVATNVVLSGRAPRREYGDRA